MPFVKGEGGRPKGAVNKSNDKVRKIIARLTEQNPQHLDDALDFVRTDNPAKFLELYFKLLEYTTPKLRAIDNKIDLAENAIEKIVVELKTRDNEPRA